MGFFQKKASDGAFDIYSDIDSRIKHYKRVNLLWSVLAFIELFAGISNVSTGICMLLKNYFFYANFIGGCICLGLGIMFLSLTHSVRIKIKKLEKEKIIIE